MNKLTKSSLTIIKIVIFVLAYYFIYTKVKYFDLKNYHIENYRYIFLVFAFFLMFINWSIESFKWQLLIKDFEQINFIKAIESVTIGIVFGLFTPNRLGEIPGKTILLKKENRLNGTFAASVGSFAQFTITLILGLLGIAFLIAFTKNNNFDKFLTDKTSIILVFLSFLLIFIYFNPKKILSLIKKTRLSSKIISKIEILSFYNIKTLIKVFLISLLRYFVFSFQFYFLLIFFNIDLSMSVAFASIFSIFLLMNILPHFVVADLGIRGSISIFVLGQYVSSVPEIIGAPIILWIINIIIPAIVGQFFISKLKIIKL